MSREILSTLTNIPDSAGVSVDKEQRHKDQIARLMKERDDFKELFQREYTANIDLLKEKERRRWFDEDDDGVRATSIAFYRGFNLGHKWTDKEDESGQYLQVRMNLNHFHSIA